MNLEQVVQRAKADIAHKYVYVMMPIPQLETLLSGLEELQRENERLKEELADQEKISHRMHRMANGYFAELQELRYPSASKEESA